MQVILELFICRSSNGNVHATGPRVSYLRQSRDITGDRTDPDGIMACDRRDPVTARAMEETGGTDFLAALSPAPAGRLAAKAAG